MFCHKTTVTEELYVPEATLELTYCGCKQLQGAKRTDVAVIILGLNAPLCVVVLNVLMAPTITIIMIHL